MLANAITVRNKEREREGMRETNKQGKRAKAGRQTRKKKERKKKGF